MKTFRIAAGKIVFLSIDKTILYFVVHGNK